MKSKKRMYILCLIFLTGIIFGSYKVFLILKENKISKQTYDSLEEYVNIESNEDISDDEIDNIFPEVDFELLKKINSDVVAWIYIEGTEINYPVVQGDDNDYYLNHLINKSSNSAGSIFMDYRNKNDFSDKHTIIYGHNMKNGSMFADLNKYKKQSYYNKYPSYYIITPDKNYIVDIIGGYVANVKENSWKLNFQSDDELSEWLEWTKEKSLFESDVEPSVDDKIITLSTCTYEFNNARFVLIGVLREY